MDFQKLIYVGYFGNKSKVYLQVIQKITHYEA